MKVVVLGAGLAGLTAAVQLSAAAHEVVVLEARAEIGGRTRSRPISGDVIELGAQFISANHRRVRKLVADAGLHLVRDHYGAGLIRWRRAHEDSGRVIPRLGPADLLALTRILFGPQGLHALSGPDRFESARAELDSRSVADWLGKLRPSGSVHHLAECLLGALFGGADLGDISLLELVGLLGREGGAYRFTIAEVARANHIAEGTGALCAYLGGRLPGHVRLAAAASAVELDDGGVAVRLDNGDVIEADHAVVAVPTTALSQIEFTPNVPGQIRDANAAVRYGQATKVAVVVAPRKPFHAKAFIGGSIMVAGWRTRRVLYGFALSDAENCDATTLADDLCRGFGVEPQTIERIETVRWPHDRLTRGTYAHVAPGRFAQFRRSLPHSHGRVRFAGAERSSWPIFMEGAVESGELAVQSLLGSA